MRLIVLVILNTVLTGTYMRERGRERDRGTTSHGAHMKRRGREQEEGQRGKPSHCKH